MKELNDMKARLSKNAFFALSLGSRELFHSNFLAWLLKEYPAMISALTRSGTQRDFEIHREKYSFDLVIVFKDQCAPSSLIVEVKVKDTPKVDQLVKYNETAQNNIESLGDSPEKLLISLTEAPFGMPAPWKITDLAELANKINDLASGCKVTPAHHVLIQNYIDLCHDLTELVRQVTEIDVKSRYFLFNRPGEEASCKRVDRLLDELRFLDTIEKHRASKLCEEMRRRSDGLSFSKFTPHFRHGFDRKQAHVGGAIQIFNPSHKKHPELSLGVHIQGNQYRRMVSFRGFRVPNRAEGKNQGEIVKFISETDQWKWMLGRAHRDGFFQLPDRREGFFKSRQVISTSQQINKLLLSYAPSQINEPGHIYQYTDIGPEEGVPTGQVIDAVIKDLQYAAQLLSDPDYVSRFREWSLRQIDRPYG
ncbi:PDDEXK-like family protein [Pontitalea aquivivens]|uniref:hypothetical protein n=1 Tax=Pontitalea aquivivens TaxID=3388663 RepID=UPI0039711170